MSVGCSVCFRCLSNEDSCESVMRGGWRVLDSRPHNDRFHSLVEVQPKDNRHFSRDVQKVQNKQVESVEAKLTKNDV